MIYKTGFLLGFLFLITKFLSAQDYSGIVSDEYGNLLQDVEVFILDEDLSVFTNSAGEWYFEASDQNARTLVFHKDGYAYEQLVTRDAATDINITLREAIKSNATIREEGYIQNGCSSVDVPDNPDWNVTFERTKLEGDLAPNSNFTRRDPSSVIEVDGVYYVWYSFSHTFNSDKIAPWDLNDIYYATSTDGIYWEEQGEAVGRGAQGAFDARSVFTTEIFVNDGKYYLVYQAADDEDGIYNRNTVGMAYAQSPDGPWTKLEEPILHPTYTNDLFFDNNAVHDPCIISYNDKFYLYYKGECNCRDNPGCNRWCNPVCGLNKQVKWGVAIADQPEGPYVKSASNPVTNTGHEVMVWPYAEGVAILQHKDGPEEHTIQFSENGVDFSIMGTVDGFPEAAGLFRTEKSNTNPHAGIEWGMGHQLKWDAGPKGWMYIYRFDKVGDQNTSIGDSESGEQNKCAVSSDSSSNQLYVNGIRDDFEVVVHSINGQACYIGEHAGDVSIQLDKGCEGVYVVTIRYGQKQFETKVLL